MPSSARHARILVVASDGDLRRSLSFLLKAEGYAVRESPTWPETDDAPAFDAAVIDHGGIERPTSGDQILHNLGTRAVILSSRPEPPSHLRRATLVRKPLIDHELIDRLHAALSESAPPGATPPAGPTT